MARIRKPQPTLSSVFFSSPEQKVVKFLLSEPTTTFSPRVIASKMKGIRGLGGAEGLTKVLADLEVLGMVEFVDNRKSVRIRDESSPVQILKTFAAVCELEGLKGLLEPHSTKGILFGSHADGIASSDSDYDLFVVSASPEEVKKITSSHPIGRQIELQTWTPEDYHRIDKNDPKLAQKLARGIVVWGTSW